MLVDEVRSIMPKNKRDDIINKIKDNARQNKTSMIVHKEDLDKEDYKWFISEGFKLYSANSDILKSSFIIIYWGKNPLSHIEYNSTEVISECIDICKEFEE